MRELAEPEKDLLGTKVEALKPAEDQLKVLNKTALKGTVWTMAAYAGAMGLRLFSNIVLSRLLVPQYFGLMTLLNTLIMGLTLFSDLGLTPNIIRSSRGDEPVFLNTAWTMQVLRGVALWVVCLCLTLPFASFYGEPRLRVMVPVIGLSLIITAFNSTSLSTLARRMAVRDLTLMELAIQLAQLAFTVAWVLIERSVWALIAGRLFADVSRLIVSYRMIPERRTEFCWDKEAARELFAFGRWVFFSTALTFLASQSDRLILGKLVSLRTLGLYGVAFALADIPRQIILSFCGHIAFPFVSKLAHLPRPEFRNLVFKRRQHVLLAAAGILAAVVATGDLFMVHIYDARYHDASWIVPILSLGLWHTLLYSTTSSCLFAVGKPHYIVTGNLLSSFVILAVTPLAFWKWGMIGAVCNVALSDLPMYFVNLYGMGREHMLPAVQDLKATFFFLLMLAVLILARLAAGFHFPQPIALH